MVRLAQLVAVAAVVGLFAASASAQRADTREARRLWREAREAADAGELETALDRFERSFAIVERASTALSIAVVAAELDRPERALAALDDLDRVADPERDAEHLEAGARLRAEVEPRLASRAPPPPEPEPITPPPPPPPAADPLEALIGPLVVIGAGVAVLGAALGTFVASQDALSQRDALCPDEACQSASDLDRAVSLHDEASALNTASGALDVVGAVLVAGGATWLVLTLVLDDDDVAVAVGPTGLAVAGRWP